MKARDWDFIETRLLGGFPQTEACHRLTELGHSDLSEQLMDAAKVFQDECRQIRDRLRVRDGRGMHVI